MTSQINPNNINGAYPVAGQDNNSQGFRDNFTNTSQNFTYAAAEITDLQNKAILKSALTGGTLNNDMLNAALTNALIADFAASAVPLGNLTGTVTVDYAAGHYYTVGTAGSLVLSFTNWPTTGQYGLVTVQVTVSSTAYTLTLPLAVSVNVAGVQGAAISGSGTTITFAAIGVYTFTFTTSNGGTTVSMLETNKQLQPYNASSDAVATTAAASLATTTSYFTTAGTATLAAGVSGQIKVLAQTAAASMVVTVANPGWTGSGTVTLAAIGDACTLQYVNSTWICIGNNGAVFG
jgi:hypothetical protein